jgi:AMP deaminase
MADGPTKTFTYTRLKVLERKFDMHCRLNGALEREATRDDPQDFITVNKVCLLLCFVCFVLRRRRKEKKIQTDPFCWANREMARSIRTCISRRG